MKKLFEKYESKKEILESVIDIDTKYYSLVSELNFNFTVLVRNEVQRGLIAFKKSNSDKFNKKVISKSSSSLGYGEYFATIEFDSQSESMIITLNMGKQNSIEVEAELSFGKKGTFFKKTFIVDRATISGISKEIVSAFEKMYA